MNEDECRIVTQSTETPSKMHRVLKLPKMSQYMNYMQLKVMNTIWNIFLSKKEEFCLILDLAIF